MSGRVRWRPFTGEPDRARMLVVGRMRVGDVVPVGDGWDATVYGTDERETFTRRRAATRWLFARAAGLAEVPRRERVRGCTVVRGRHVGRSHRHGYALPSKCATWPPRWWRIVEEYVDENVNVTCALVERNRRRR